MMQAPTPISLLVFVFLGMVASLAALSLMIIREKSGYKGPSKVIAERYKKSVMRHPEMSGVKDARKLLVVDLSKLPKAKS